MFVYLLLLTYVPLKWSQSKFRAIIFTLLTISTMQEWATDPKPLKRYICISAARWNQHGLVVISQQQQFPSSSDGSRGRSWSEIRLSQQKAPCLQCQMHWKHCSTVDRGSLWVTQPVKAIVWCLRCKDYKRYKGGSQETAGVALQTRLLWTGVQ